MSTTIERCCRCKVIKTRTTNQDGWHPQPDYDYESGLCSRCDQFLFPTPHASVTFDYVGSPEAVHAWLLEAMEILEPLGAESPQETARRVKKDAELGNMARKQAESLGIPVDRAIFKVWDGGVSASE